MKKLSLIILLFHAAIFSRASGVKTISTSDGLSNNTVFSLCQDHLGNMWIGTSDGLNIWDGHSLELFDSQDGKNFFAGNTVREMYDDGSRGIWVQTYYGIAHIDVHTRFIRYYDSFTHIRGMACGRDGIPYFLSSEGMLYRYEKKSDSFVPTEINLKNEDFKRLHRFGEDWLYCFTATGVYVIRIGVDDKTAEVKPTLEDKRNEDILFVSSTPRDGCCYFVSGRSRDIKVFDMETREVTVFASLGGTPFAKEMIRALLPYEEGLYVGGSASGVCFLSSGNQTSVSTPFKTGIWTLVKDNRQDIVWVGTDGRGVHRWHMSEYNFEQISYDRLPARVGMPVRTVFRDKEGKLWCGTKGDGIFTIDNLSPYVELTERNVRKMTAGNSGLINNNVYSIAGSCNGIWIGSDGPGLNYWSYSEKKIRKVPGSEPIKRVHGIYEQNENTLWVCTHGRGAFRCDMTGSRSGHPRIVKIAKIEFPHPFNRVSNIFSMYAQNDSLIWFGSRGAGAACYNTRTGEVHLCAFSTPQGLTYNDIYGMVATDRMHFATGCGLFSYDSASGSYGIVDEIPKRAIHGILSDGDNLWLSTNYGIVCFNEKDKRSVVHNKQSGLDILEYSDGASFKDDSTREMFFGSNTGLTIIRRTEKYQRDSTLFIPEIHIVGTVSNHIRTPLEGDLVLPWSDALPAVVFSVVDNINYADYEFSYRIVGVDNHWRENGNSNVIPLPALKAGDYTLEIRYNNKSTSYVSAPRSLKIEIVPPIYASWWAKTLYVLTALAVAAYYIRRFRLQYLMMKEELERRRLQEGVDPHFLEKLLQVINDNIADPSLSVSFITDKMCISRRALFRKLENAPNLKPQQLITDARMKRSAELLGTTGLTVEEIMFKVGYDNRSTFYTNFKKTYGCTPKEYREQKVHN